jgi:hypothetical protein
MRHNGHFEAMQSICSLFPTIQNKTSLSRLDLMGITPFFNQIRVVESDSTISMNMDNNRKWASQRLQFQVHLAVSNIKIFPNREVPRLKSSICMKQIFVNLE